ncbi:hypothetical protein H1R20_g12535, partial [Candolleomyces eurysporus]
MNTLSPNVDTLVNVPSWSTCPPEIHQLVFSFLSVFQLLMVAGSSRYNYFVVKKHIRDRVNDLLKQWSLPNAFVEFMKNHDVVFSGSAVLALLEPDSLTPNDLDTYVPLGALPAVEAFLSTHTLYIAFDNLRSSLGDEADEYVSDGTADTGVNAVAFYRHPTTNAVLNVIETTHAIPIAAIFKFHSTFVMNFLTYNALVSAYPRMTADHVGLVNTRAPTMSLRMHRCLLKYGVRGFNALDRAFDWTNEEHDCFTYPYCGPCPRVVSDRSTMRIGLALDIGSLPDVIDPQLSWSLARRYDCSLVKRIVAEKGLVTAGIPS